MTSETTPHILRKHLKSPPQSTQIIIIIQNLIQLVVHCVIKINKFFLFAYQIATNIPLLHLNRARCHLPKHFQAKPYLLKVNLLLTLPLRSRDKLDTVRISKKKDLELLRFIPSILTQNKLQIKVLFNALSLYP